MGNIFRVDRWYRDVLGHALANCLVFVTQGNISATLYADPNGLHTLQQPLVTDGQGYAAFYAQGHAAGAPIAASDFYTITVYLPSNRLFRTEQNIFVGSHI